MSSWEIRQGDCVEQMAAMAPESVDAVVCDPPYGIGFMGHEWDQPGEHGATRRMGKTAPYAQDRRDPGVHAAGPDAAAARSTLRDERQRGERDHTKTRDRSSSMQAGHYDLSATANRRFQAWCEAWAREALRVLKPGGHMLVCGGTRTYHRMAAGIEDAGFEIRDCLVWLYGSGFPKSLDVGKAMLTAPATPEAERWDGWGTALKPAHEPIVVARKPLAGTVAANVWEHGTGALNVDGCRVDVADDAYARNHSGDRGHGGTRSIKERGSTDLRPGGGSASTGRWPANVVLDEEAADQLDAQMGELVSGANPTRRGGDKFRTAYGDFEGQRECEPARGVDRGGASRFFYVAKASRSERGAGNSHPTVKPVALMEWLVRLVTPPGGLVLDPFTGSGTTGIAALREGFAFVGIEREAAYVDIARGRIRDDSPLINGAAEVAA